MLQEIKDYLKITWNDEDVTIQGIIDRGKSNLNELAGVELDFLSEGQARSLLFNYCRYDYRNGIEDFEENFKSEILRLQEIEGGEMLSTLSSLLIGTLNLSPEFNPKTKEYTVSTNGESNIILAKPIMGHYYLDITVNSKKHENGTPYTWNHGENIVSIFVGCEYMTTTNTYTIIVTKS